MTQLQALLSQVDSGTMLLPEFQRGYVWNRDQVRGLLRSLYLGYPVGSLLVWETQTTEEDVRGTDVQPGVRTLLLDGQQRLTSLYGVSRGFAPAFFEGDEKAFLNLYFNVVEESFEFYAPKKMKGDAKWVSVTDLLSNGLVSAIDSLKDELNSSEYFARLATLQNIMTREFHVEKIAGADKTTDLVVDIFNKVNSGGTRLSKGDLALAKITSQSPELRSLMRQHIERWHEAGYDFKLDWLLRCVNAIATKKSKFAFLDEVSIADFNKSLNKAVSYIDLILNLLASRLGLDHDKVLIGRFSFPVLCVYLDNNGGSFKTKSEQDLALYFYIHAGLWGRYAGSTESVLQQDLDLLLKGGLNEVIRNLSAIRGGSLQVQPDDFRTMGLGSRFYPLLYLLTRVGQARDFGTGILLRENLLGKLSSLQVHHIFPKALLRDSGYSRQEINAVANFCFLTQDTNLAIGKKSPNEYFVDIHDIKGLDTVLDSQWIPMNRELWNVEAYRDFLSMRRKLLADAANEFLNELISGKFEDLALSRILVDELETSSSIEGEVEKIKALVETYGLSAPGFDVPVEDPETGEVLCVAEAFWDTGLQAGIGNPVVLELDQDIDQSRFAALGFEVFTTTDDLERFLARRAVVEES